MAAGWGKLFGAGQTPETGDGPRLGRPAPHESTGVFVGKAANDRISSQAPANESDAELPHSVVLARTFDSIGRRNESLRAQLDAIEFAFNNIEVIKTHFHDVLQPINDVLGDIEQRATTNQRDTESKHEALTGAHNQLKGDHSLLVVERDGLSNRHEDLQAKSKLLETSLNTAEASLTEARASISERNLKIDRLERELEDAKRRLVTVQDQLPAIRAEFAIKEKRLQEVEQARANLHDQHNILTQENQSLRTRAEELVASSSKLNREVGELEGDLADARRRIGELESSFKQETAAHSKLRSTHVEASETHRATLASLQSEFNSVTARSEAAERILADARDELRGRNAIIRVLEQQAVEGSLAVQARDRSLADMEKDLSAARQQISELDVARSALVERTTDLTKVAQTRESALERATSRIESLEAKIADLTRSAAIAKEHWEQTVVKLTDRLDAEVAARTFAEGALQTARQERGNWQRDARPAPDQQAPTANEVPNDKVTRLRG
jgi:crescentin